MPTAWFLNEADLLLVIGASFSKHVDLGLLEVKSDVGLI